MFEPLKLEILSKSQTVLEADSVAWVQVQLADGGSIGIYPGHTPLIAETIVAPLRYALDDTVHSITLDAGILMIEKGKVFVLAEESNNNTIYEPIVRIDVRRLLQKLQATSSLDEILAEGNNGRG